MSPHQGAAFAHEFDAAPGGRLDVLDLDAIDLRIAEMIEKSPDSTTFIEGMITSDVRGVGSLDEALAAARVYGDSKYVGEFGQLVFIRALCARVEEGFDWALHALPHMDQLHVNANDTPQARQYELALVGDIDNA